MKGEKSRNNYLIINVIIFLIFNLVLEYSVQAQDPQPNTACQSYLNDVLDDKKELEHKVKDLEQRIRELEKESNQRILNEKSKLENQISMLHEKERSFITENNKKSDKIQSLNKRINRMDSELKRLRKRDAECQKCIKMQEARKQGGKDYARALELYEMGLVDEAINRLITEIKRDPNNEVARRLLEEIEGREKLKRQK